VPIHNQFIRDQDKELLSAGLTGIGPVFPIEVHVPPLIAEALDKAGEPIPSPVSGMALIDTGASITCVNEPVLKDSLKLNPIGVVNAGTANGPVQQNVYPGRLVFPTEGWTLDVDGVMGVNLTGQTINLEPPQDLIALLGRNLLERWIFTYNGPGAMWTVSF